MASYKIDYPWLYNPHGPEGSPCMEQEIILHVQYYIQPSEPDVGLDWSIQIEEVLQDGVPLCTDAAKECGWYPADEQRLLDSLYDSEYANGKPVKPAATGADT